jgi:iron(III) transport system substrate-binding protein
MRNTIADRQNPPGFEVSKAKLLGLVLSCFTFVIAAPLRAQDDWERTLYEKAKQEGEITWYSAQINQQLSDAVGAAFTAKYSGVKVNVVRSTSSVAYNRLQQDFQAGSSQADVFSSSNPGHLVTLQQEKKLEQYTPPNKVELLAKFRDSNSYFHTTYAAIVIIAYNKSKVKEAEAPRSWAELLKPEWAGKIGTGHPGFSGEVAVWCVQMNKLLGGDFFQKFARNKALTGRSIYDTETMLNSGERVVAVSDLSFTLQSASKGNPLGVIYPEEGAVLVIGPSGIVKGARHESAAKLFLNFLMSQEAGKITSAQFELPLRADVTPPPGAKPVSEIKTILVPADETATGTPLVTEKWRDAFGS